MAIQTVPSRRSTILPSGDVGAAPARRSARCADDRFERLRRPCPICDVPGARIVYGVPSRALAAAARQGKVILGGCTHSAATHQCPSGHRWEQPGA